ASLQEWQGPQHVSLNFNANLLAETYNSHMALLQGIRAQSPRAHEKLLVRLYREAS
ncbi:hypothetical protein B0H10DRAFT_1812148, partial [Mycena sp. CBHHK59/15]